MVLGVEGGPELQRRQRRRPAHAVDLPHRHVEARLELPAAAQRHPGLPDRAHGPHQPPGAEQPEPPDVPADPEGHQEHPPALEPVLVEGPQVEDPRLQRQSVERIGPEHRPDQRPPVPSHARRDLVAEAALDLLVPVGMGVEEVQHRERRGQLHGAVVGAAALPTLTSEPCLVRRSLLRGGSLELRQRDGVGVVVHDEPGGPALQGAADGVEPEERPAQEGAPPLEVEALHPPPPRRGDPPRAPRQARQRQVAQQLAGGSRVRVGEQRTVQLVAIEQHRPRDGVEPRALGAGRRATARELLEPLQEARSVRPDLPLGVADGRPREDALRAEDPRVQQGRVVRVEASLEAVRQVEELRPSHALVEGGRVPRQALQPHAEGEQHQAHPAEQDERLPHHASDPADDGVAPELRVPAGVEGREGELHRQVEGAEEQQPDRGPGGARHERRADAPHHLAGGQGAVEVRPPEHAAQQPVEGRRDPVHAAGHVLGRRRAQGVRRRPGPEPRQPAEGRGAHQPRRAAKALHRARAELLLQLLPAHRGQVPEQVVRQREPVPTAPRPRAGVLGRPSQRRRERAVARRLEGVPLPVLRRLVRLQVPAVHGASQPRHPPLDLHVPPPGLPALARRREQDHLPLQRPGVAPHDPIQPTEQEPQGANGPDQRAQRPQVGPEPREPQEPQGAARLAGLRHQSVQPRQQAEGQGRQQVRPEVPSEPQPPPGHERQLHGEVREQEEADAGVHGERQRPGEVQTGEPHCTKELGPEHQEDQQDRRHHRPLPRRHPRPAEAVLQAGLQLLLVQLPLDPAAAPQEPGPRRAAVGLQGFEVPPHDVEGELEAAGADLGRALPREEHRVVRVVDHAPRAPGPAGLRHPPLGGVLPERPAQLLPRRSDLGRQRVLLPPWPAAAGDGERVLLDL